MSGLLLIANVKLHFFLALANFILSAKSLLICSLWIDLGLYDLHLKEITIFSDKEVY